MTTYKGVKGIGIQSVDADAVASQAAGGSWASSNNLNTGRRALASAGIQTAALAIGGTPPTTGKTEVYNG